MSKNATTTRSGRISNPPPPDETLSLVQNVAVPKKRGRKSKTVVEVEIDDVEMEPISELYDEFYDQLNVRAGFAIYFS